MRAVGENLAATIRGETTILEHMTHDNVLNDFYVTGLGLDKYTTFLSNAILQLTHRYVNMDILEIGMSSITIQDYMVNIVCRSGHWGRYQNHHKAAGQGI
jgi:hypothetical protein